jgi:hypothetical protein
MCPDNIPRDEIMMRRFAKGWVAMCNYSRPPISGRGRPGRPALCGLILALVLTSSTEVLATPSFGLGWDVNHYALHGLPDKSIVNGSERRVTLCQRTTVWMLGLGVFMTDGYSIRFDGTRTDPPRYRDLDDVEIRNFQSKGMLPDPMPPIDFLFLEYVNGYAFWIVLSIYLVARPIVRRANTKRRTKLLGDERYREALEIVRQSDGEGYDEAVEFLVGKDIPLSTAQNDLNFLAEHGKESEAGQP